MSSTPSVGPSRQTKNPGIFISAILFVLSGLGAVFIATATYEHGLHGFTQLTSVFITKHPPRTHSFIEVFPFLACAALFTALPILLFDRTRRSLTAFSIIAISATWMLSVAGKRIPEKLDEYSIFSSGSIEHSQLIRIFGAKIFYHRHGRTYAVEINPHHLVPHGPYISVTDRTYDFVRSALYQVPVPPDPNDNGGWQSDYCLRFTVEKAGPYERIVFLRHFIRSDELVSCPKDAV